MAHGVPFVITHGTWERQMLFANNWTSQQLVNNSLFIIKAPLTGLSCHLQVTLPRTLPSLVLEVDPSCWPIFSALGVKGSLESVTLALLLVFALTLKMLVSDACQKVELAFLNLIISSIFIMNSLHKWKGSVGWEQFIGGTCGALLRRWLGNSVWWLLGHTWCQSCVPTTWSQWWL